MDKRLVEPETMKKFFLKILDDYKKKVQSERILILKSKTQSKDGKILDDRKLQNRLIAVMDLKHELNKEFKRVFRVIDKRGKTNG